MRRTLQTLPLLLALLSGMGLSCHAQPHSAGIEFSAFSIGASYRHASQLAGMSVLHSIDAGAEMTGPYLQRTSYPGAYASYSCNFALMEVKGWDFSLALIAGPGATIGWAEDLHCRMGVIFGPHANIGGEFRFSNSPVRVSICIKPTLGIHMHRTSSGDIAMATYSNGLLSSIVPKIGIHYSLDNQTHRPSEETPTQERHSGKIPELLSLGIEFGYIAQFHVFSHFNYTTDGGYRVNHEDRRINYYSNANVLASFGINAGNHFNLAIMGGYQGLSRHQRVFPLCLWSTVLFGQADAQGRWLCYAGGGIGFKGSPKMFGNAMLMHLGWGYRIRLAGRSGLDLLCSINSSFWHPNTFSESIHVRRSNDLLVGLNLGVGFSF